MEGSREEGRERKRERGREREEGRERKRERGREREERETERGSTEHYPFDIRQAMTS